MGGTTKTPPANDSYQQILQAMLDSYRHPVWILGDFGVSLMNEPARELERQGFAIQQLTQNMSVGEMRIFRFKGKDLSIKKSAIKSGGTVLLHEVSFESPSTARLKASTARLRTALAR
jgi:hypothetical protein